MKPIYVFFNFRGLLPDIPLVYGPALFSYKKLNKIRITALAKHRRHWKNVGLRLDNVRERSLLFKENECNLISIERSSTVLDVLQNCRCYGWFKINSLQKLQ